jgi:Domain of unknown function (DUF4365)
MPLLTPQGIEEELSYAYIHAVAAHAGMSVQIANRPLDTQGVDLTISAADQFAPDSINTDLSLHVQVKATSQVPPETPERYSYFFDGIAQYNKLREGRSLPVRILAVLFLPAGHANWLTFAPDQLLLRRCAYWTSLAGAPPSDNGTGQTIYLPKANILSPDGLRDIMTRLSRDEHLRYNG